MNAGFPLPSPGHASALAGLRVLDLGQIWAGPLCSNMLGDMGAEVIRVETRSRAAMGGRLEFAAQEPVEHAYSYYLRNRICMSADVTEAKGRDLVKGLVRISDVLVENFGPRTMTKLGLDFATLRAVNPSLILLSLPAAGSTGPWSNRLTQGPTLSGLYGRSSLIGYPGEAWPRSDTAEGDPLGASFGFIAVMAALMDRRHTGLGQHIDLSQGEALLCLDAEAVIEYTMNRRVIGFTGNMLRGRAPHGIFPCAGEDQWIGISVETSDQYAALLDILEGPGSGESRFSSPFYRFQEKERLEALIAEGTRRFDPWTLTRRLQSVGVPAYPVLNARGQLDDSHLQFRRGMGITAQPGVRTEEVTFTSPWKLTETPVALRRATPSIGADTAAVLTHILGTEMAEP